MTTPFSFDLAGPGPYDREGILACINEIDDWLRKDDHTAPYAQDESARRTGVGAVRFLDRIRGVAQKVAPDLIPLAETVKIRIGQIVFKVDPSTLTRLRHNIEVPFSSTPLVRLVPNVSDDGLTVLFRVPCVLCGIDVQFTGVGGLPDMNEALDLAEQHIWKHIIDLSLGLALREDERRNP